MGVRLSIVSAGSHKTKEPLTYQFEQERIVIGRGSGVDVRIPDLTISETHAIITFQAGGFVIMDTNSTNGTLVNGEKLIPERGKTLVDGDRIEMGGYVLLVETRVLVADPTSTERTSELARRLLREKAQAEFAEVASARLFVVDGSQAGLTLTIPAPPARLLVGRSESCQMVLSDEEVSREHMEVICDLDGVMVRNLDSKNGISLGDHPVVERRLKHGNQLLLGSTRLEYDDPAEDSIRLLSNQSDLSLPPRIRREENSNLGSSENPTSLGDIKVESPIKVSKAKKKGRKGVLSSAVDLAIYFFAIVILMLSLAGLILLLRMK